MEDAVSISKDVLNRMKKLQAEMDELRDTVDDATLSEDDLEAIKAGQREFIEGRTREL